MIYYINKEILNMTYDFTHVWQNHLEEGFVDQDKFERFSAKRAHNQHT
jgi:hypothetical protein